MYSSFAPSNSLSQITDQNFGSRLNAALADMRRGVPVLLTDDVDRENEADLIASAESVSNATMAMMIRECSGIVCLCITHELADHMNLPLMVPDNQSKYKTAFTVSIEARRGVTTGVSAADRITTIRTAIADSACAEDLARPGHVFPLRVAEGGLFARQGHTEGAVELARLAGMKPAAILSELTNPDGSMAKGDSIMLFAQKHHLSIITIDELVRYQRNELNVHDVNDVDAMLVRL